MRGCNISRCLCGFSRRTERSKSELKIDVPANRTFSGEKPVGVIISNSEVRQRDFQKFCIRFYARAGFRPAYERFRHAASHDPGSRSSKETSLFGNYQNVFQFVALCTG